MIMGMGQDAGFTAVPEARFIRNMFVGDMTAMPAWGFVEGACAAAIGSRRAALRMRNLRESEVTGLLA